ncbi:MAG: hypothetical protein V4692_16270, partial [Bdellovibrionota bacterium]
NMLDLASQPGSSFVSYFTGQVDMMDDKSLWGWIRFDLNPDVKVPLKVIYQGKKVATMIAHDVRDDVKAAGFEDGKFGFYMSVAGFDFQDLSALKIQIDGTSMDVVWGPEMNKLASSSREPELAIQ